MLSTETLPSLIGIADVILSEARAGQVILFSFPSRDIWEQWRGVLFQAIKNRLNEQGGDSPWNIFSPHFGNEGPEQQIANFLGLPKSDQESVLTSGFSDTPLFIELFCDGELDPAWNNFIERAARFFRVYENLYNPRIVCIFLIDPPRLPPVKTDAGLRCYAFWNPLKWEEVRLLVSESVHEKENPLVRAWKISTYAGAAGSDPRVVARLVRVLPTTLEAVRSEIIAFRQEREQFGDQLEEPNRFYPETRWDVPSGLIGHWRAGALTGTTLDRGATTSWQSIAEGDIPLRLKRAIWREQLAGIFPLLMEITFYTSEAITSSKGPAWKTHLQSDNDGRVTAEPKEILDIFNHHGLGRLPDTIYQLLQKLRDTRNKLAHLEPVDLRDVQQVYSLFDQVAKR